MKFYDLSQADRTILIDKIYKATETDLINGSSSAIRIYCSDEDTYIRKNSYLALSNIYQIKPELRDGILKLVKILLHNDNELIRQTAAYALGEIGKKDADAILNLLAAAMHDTHHKVHNAVIGALKQMGQKNPSAMLRFAATHLHDPDPEVRREIIHGLELRGRTHPWDVLPLLKELQFESEKRPRKMIVHVIGQISYKHNCLEAVTKELKTWDNIQLVKEALQEIMIVHKSYE